LRTGRQENRQYLSPLRLRMDRQGWEQCSVPLLTQKGEQTGRATSTNGGSRRQGVHSMDLLHQRKLDRRQGW
jgi:hypothetical protein